MNKAEALRLKPGQVVHVQHGNGRPVAPEKRVTVAGATWTCNPWRAGVGVPGAHDAGIPLRANEAKRLSASAEWVRVRDTDGKDWDSRELVHMPEGP